MIRKISLRFGAAPGEPPLRFRPGALTVFVGPNNSGKSLALREILHCVSTERGRGARILRRVHRRLPRGPLRDQLLERLHKEVGPLIRLEPPRDRESASAAMEVILFLGGWGDLAQKRIHPGRLAAAMRTQTPPTSREFARWLSEHHRAGTLDQALLHLLRTRALSYEPDASLMAEGTILLDGKGRLSTVEPTGAPELRFKDKNPFTNLLKDERARRHLRRIVHEAIDLYPVLDATSGRATFLKLSEQEPPDGIERSLAQKAIRFMDRARDIREFSDGVKSFTGLIATVLSERYQLMLIDEPEAFLHPTLTRKLGFELHRLARRRRGHVIAATHSPEFVTGCLQAGHDVNIVRLTYRRGRATARQLPVDSLQQMMQEPLLRSTGALSALSHVAVVICEGETDRALYQEISDRIRAKDQRLEGALFLSALGKSSIHKLLRPLHAIGLPVAAIVDLDFIGEKADHQELLSAVGAENAIPAIGTAKAALRKAFLASVPEALPDDQREQRAKQLIKAKGISALRPEDRTMAQTTFIEPLARYGIFVVPGGELETWLPDLFPEGDVPAKGEWIARVFERLGSDPTSKDYVEPGEHGIWDFMRRVVAWLSSRR